MSGSEENQIRATFAYKPSWRRYKRDSINNRHCFFFHALRGNRHLQVGYFPA